MNSLRKTMPAIAGLVLAAAMVVGGASSALAAPPYPNGGQGTALVSGTPLIQASCTTAPAQSTGSSVLGTVRVANASASCTPQATAVGGSYSLDGTTPTLQFAAQCVNTADVTGGAVIVPAGTNVPGVGVVTQPTTVTQNVTVTYPNGSVAVLNQVTTTTTSITRTAIRVTSGPGAGAVIGRAVCGTPFPYPLAVDAEGSSAPADLALPPISDGGSSSNRMLYIGGALALLVIAQLAVGRTVLRRRRGLTEG
jgi:hypothetical protein